VLAAPLALLLLGRPVRGRAAPAALLPLVGVALLTLGLVGLLESRWAVYATGGALGTAALLAGAAAARAPATSRSPAGGG
jgi:drug/metabolite transporter (DMT)-like permease